MKKSIAGFLFFLDQMTVHAARLSAYIYLHDPQDAQKTYAMFILLSVNALRMPLKFYWLQKIENCLPDGEEVQAPQIEDSPADAKETEAHLTNVEETQALQIEKIWIYLKKAEEDYLVNVEKETQVQQIEDGRMEDRLINVEDRPADATETQALLPEKKREVRFKIETGLDYVVCGSPILISFAMLVSAFTLKFSAQNADYTQVCIGITVLFKLWDEGRNIKFSRDFINDMKAQGKFTDINYRHKMHRGFFTAQGFFTFLECLSFIFGGIYALSTGAPHYRFYLAAFICCCASAAFGLMGAMVSARSYNLLEENLLTTPSR